MSDDAAMAGALCDHGNIRRAGSGHGPLTGKTFAAKDVVAVAGFAGCAGSPDWLASHDAAQETAPAVRALLEAGADLVGMAKCDELMYSISGTNVHYGIPVNPRGPGRLPGGSSSGSASAVASGLADFALGTDTTGSLRTPAALCGLWSLRVGHGSVSVDGVVPLAPAFDTVGALAREPDLLHAVYSVIIDRPQVDPTWRRALVPAAAWEAADPAVRDALGASLRRVTRALAAVNVPADDMPLTTWAEHVRVRQGAQAWEVFGDWVEATRPALGPGTAERLQFAASVTPGDAERAAAAMTDAAARIRGLLGDDAVTVLPTSPAVAPLANSPEAELNQWRSRVMQLTSIANISGLPQVVVPGADAHGLPVSLSLVGPEGSELALLRLAQELIAA